MIIGTRLKQMINTVYMYLYLQYYRYKLRTNTRFMIKESIENMENLREDQ